MVVTAAWSGLIKTKMVDEATKKSLASIPLLKTKAGPRDKDSWVIRLKEEYGSLIKVIYIVYVPPKIKRHFVYIYI